MKTINILLLEDMEDDFAKTETAIKEISKTLQSENIHLELLYNFEEARRLISNFVASDKMPHHLQEPLIAAVNSTVEQVKQKNNLVCILDIVWGVDATNRARRQKTGTDQYGCTFFCRYLNENKFRKNTIIVSALDKTPEIMGAMTHVSKVSKRLSSGADGFKHELKNAICALPIINVRDNKKTTKGDVFSTHILFYQELFERLNHSREASERYRPVLMNIRELITKYEWLEKNNVLVADQDVQSLCSICANIAEKSEYDNISHALEILSRYE